MGVECLPKALLTSGEFVIPYGIVVEKDAKFLDFCAAAMSIKLDGPRPAPLWEGAPIPILRVNG